MRRTTVVLAALVAVLTGACGSRTKTTASSPGAETPAPKPVACTGDKLTTVHEGMLTVGSDIAYAPFESVNPQAGKPEGFDVDLLTEIAKRNDLKVEFTNQAFAGIIPGLLAKKFDVIASAMTITPERRAQICFSDPYFDADQSLAVNTQATPDIKDTSGLKGEVVGVQQETTGAAWANEHLKGTASEIKEYETIDDAFLDLKSAKIAGIINDIPVNLYRAKQDKVFAVVEKIKTDEKYGIAVAPTNKGLLDAVNAALKDIRSDGTYDTIYEKWFGAKPGGVG